jgi:hypothetical protein
MKKIVLDLPPEQGRALAQFVKRTDDNKADPLPRAGLFPKTTRCDATVTRLNATRARR